MSDMMKKPMVLELHIPYCIRPEKYQEHYFAVGSNEEKNRYLEALTREIVSYGKELEDFEIKAVCLSGGSATVMSPDRLGGLLKTVRETLPVSKNAEVSVDAHPLTIGTPALTGIASGKPNRMELYIRSDNSEELQTLDCSFTKQDIQNALLFFHRFHVNNIGLTVNYGIPGQTLQTWRQTLHSCVILHQAHITIEAIHVRKEDDTAGKTLPIPAESEREEMYYSACRYLKENGYLQYSPNHFALPHRGWLYQLLLMEGASKLAIGVGAQSRYGGYYVRNTNNLNLYLRTAGDYEKVTASVTRLEDIQEQCWYAAMRLRSTAGLSEETFRERFGKDFPEALVQGLERAQQEALVSEADRTFVPTEKGLYLMSEGNGLL